MLKPAPPRKTDPWSWTSRYIDGMMFVCNNDTYDECIRIKLLGLPRQYLRTVQSLLPETSALFLFNMSTRLLHGLFEPTEAGGENLNRSAWNRDGSERNGSRYPAQVPFKNVYEFRPLQESVFRHMFDDGNRIRKLDGQQVADIINLFKARDKRNQEMKLRRGTAIKKTAPVMLSTSTSKANPWNKMKAKPKPKVASPPSEFERRSSPAEERKTLPTPPPPHSSNFPQPPAPNVTKKTKESFPQPPAKVPKPKEPEQTETIEEKIYHHDSFNAPFPFYKRKVKKKDRRKRPKEKKITSEESKNVEISKEKKELPERALKLIDSYSGFEGSDLFAPMKSDRSPEPDRRDPTRELPSNEESLLNRPMPSSDFGDDGKLKFESWGIENRFDFLDQPISDLNNPISELNNSSTAPTTDVSDQFLPGDLLSGMDSLLKDDNSPFTSNKSEENSNTQGPQLGLFLLGDTKFDRKGTWERGNSIW